MDTLGRVIKRVASGSASTSNRFAAYEALDALSGQVWLTSDINHLAEEASYRTLAAHPGWTDFQRPPPTGGVPTSAAFFDWTWEFSYSPNNSAACLGAHIVYRVASAPNTWPKLVLRARVVPPTSSSEYLNVCLAVAPGMPSYAIADEAGSMCALARVAGNGAAWADLTISLPLADSYLASTSRNPLLGSPASGVPAPTEPVIASVLTAWVSANVTTGKCSMAGITLGLEPP